MNSMAISRPTLWPNWGTHEKNLKISLSSVMSMAFICFWAQMFRLVMRPVFNLYFWEQRSSGDNSRAVLTALWSHL